MTSLGDNIKIHFAGAEMLDQSIPAYDAGVKCFLFTCFPWISKEIGISGFPVLVKNVFVSEQLEKMSKHLIMDSGLFTLMFGAHAGKKDKKLIFRYYDHLVRFVTDNHIKATCVECDCQKVLGVQEAWYLREKMKEALPNNRIINVFHYEDGRKGLDRLIEYSDFIAISVPELRAIHQKTYKSDAVILAKYIKKKKPSIDIHLLGCTESDILRQTKFCTSADSTSWKSGIRWGKIEGYKTNNINQKILQKETYMAAKSMLSKCGMKETPKKIENYSIFYLSAKMALANYTRTAGSQQ